MQSLKEKQSSEIKSISDQIWLCSTKFDIDSTHHRVSDLDILVRNKKVIIKNLESDDLYFVEGSFEKNIFNKEEIEKELRLEEIEERAFEDPSFKKEFEEMQ